MTVRAGQISIFIYLGVVLIMCGLVRERQWLLVAGLAIVFLKPQIGAVVALALLMTGRPGIRAILFATLISVLLIIPAMMVKVDVLLDWLRVLASYEGVSRANLPIAMSGIRNLVWVFGGSDIGTFAAMGSTFAASISVMYVLRRIAIRRGQSKQSAALDQIVAQSLVIMAFAPLHLYDFTLLGVAFVAVTGAKGSRAVTVGVVTAIIMQPSILYFLLGGEYLGTIFPGSTMATIAVIVILHIFLTRAPAPRALATVRIAC